MSKKTIAMFVATIALASTLTITPAFAQQQQGSGNPGVFGMFVQFFSHMFGGNGQTPGQPQGNQNLPNGTPSDMPTGMPFPTGTTGHMGEGNRLQGLVTAGKLTQSQEQEITAEVSKLQSEISSWASYTGINAAYVYGALTGPGMSGGIGSGHGVVQGGVTPSGFQGRPGFIPGQGGYNQGGQPNGGFMGPRATQQ
ncbi:MAG: hypothetical protein KGJ07_00455 [Patescibacteria group bacterium]|nr:hypothetical protein [Patescibacteria group bacterium]MDE2588123.1 hypothetical protein [Patescibacteria group bacterium]